MLGLKCYDHFIICEVYRKRLFVLSAILLSLLICGCAPNSTVVPSDTINTIFPEENQSLIPNNTVTESLTPVITPTPTPLITLAPAVDAFGFVDKVDGEVVTIVLCDLVFHMSDDLDKFGEPYGHDWVEIVHTNDTLELKAISESEYIYADLFSLETDYDGTYKMKNISRDEFLQNCVKKYYNTPLYFNFKYAENELTYAELYLLYYTAG